MTRSGGWCAVLLAALWALLVGCAAEPVPPPDPGAGRGARPVTLPADCSARVSDPDGLAAALAGAQPGAVVCVTGDLGAIRLVMTRSGAPGRPVTVVGDGQATVGGITIQADHVVVRGLTSVGGAAPGVLVRGTDVTVEDNTVRHPVGGDFDGVRFFGTDLRIVRNTIVDITPTGGDDPPCVQTHDPPPDPATPGVVLRPGDAEHGSCDAHADCFQTFASGPDGPEGATGVSRAVRIEGNSCQRVEGHCLVAQGPRARSGTGSGQGESRDIVFADNQCDAHASQAVLVDDVQDVVIRGNRVDSTDFEGSAGVFKAFAFANGSTGGVVEGNEVAPFVTVEVAVDASSRPGYRGPDPVGVP